MKLLFMAAVMVLSCGNAAAQREFLEDLSHRLNSSREDTNRVLVLSELADYYGFNQFDSCIVYSQKAVDLSKPNTERDEQLENEILDDIKVNEEKINHHGKRADAIVKGMLQHSGTSSGQKEPIDINALADEYLRLAYHGMRARDKSFNVKTETNFDSSIGTINVIPQEMGRVILNLINNAFYAVREKQKTPQLLKGEVNYEPTVTISTTKQNGKVEIKVKDNGNGIPQKILDKIFQPFFTTKPTGQGTGLVYRWLMIL